MIRKLDHIGIAVRSIDEALRAYRDGLGISCNHRETVEEQQVETAFLRVGETHLELLEPTDPEGPVGRYLERRGEGVHHLCFEVEDLEAAMDRCREAGLRLIDSRPRRGAQGKRVAFLHPKSTHGVLIELSQASGD